MACRGIVMGHHGISMNHHGMALSWACHVMRMALPHGNALAMPWWPMAILWIKAHRDGPQRSNMVLPWHCHAIATAKRHGKTRQGKAVAKAWHLPQGRHHGTGMNEYKILHYCLNVSGIAMVLPWTTMSSPWTPVALPWHIMACHDWHCHDSSWHALAFP